MGRDTGAVALQYVEEAVARARSAGLVRLPPIRQMARDAGVAHAFISRAVEDLVHRSVLQTRPSRGTTIVTAQRPLCSGPDRASARWARLSMRFSTDCLNGIYGGADALPTLKELSARYQTSAVTMRKVLRHLESTGSIAAAGRGYRLRSNAPAGNRDTILLLARANTAGDLIAAFPQDEQYLFVLEQVCRARDVRLQVVPCRHAEPDRLIHGRGGSPLARVPDDPRVLGFLIWQHGFGNIKNAMRHTLAQLVPKRKPIALFSGNDDPLFTSRDVGTRLLRCFTSDNDFGAGRAVGSYLVSLGHRRVCYFTSCVERDWERDRLAGLRSAYAEHGLEQGIVLCSAATAEQERRIARNWHEDATGVAEAIRAVARKRGLNYRADRLSDHAATFVSVDFYREMVFRLLEPHMCRIVRDPSITAWIGSNDAVAVECLAFLRTRQVRVPQQVSVIGFDDSAPAASWCMSSYCFNDFAAIHRMVDYVLRPDSPASRAGAQMSVAVQGFVHERTTTGPA